MSDGAWGTVVAAVVVGSVVDAAGGDRFGDVVGEPVGGLAGTVASLPPSVQAETTSTRLARIEPARRRLDLAVFQTEGGRIGALCPAEGADRCAGTSTHL